MFLKKTLVNLNFFLLWAPQNGIKATKATPLAKTAYEPSTYGPSRC